MAWIKDQLIVQLNHVFYLSLNYNTRLSYLFNRRGLSRLPLKLVVIRKSVMQLIEYPRTADRLRQMVTVQVGLKLRLYMSEHQIDAPASKFRLKFLNSPSSAVIHFGNSTGVYQYPTHKRKVIRSQKATDFIGKPARIGVEKWGSKAVDR